MIQINVYLNKSFISNLEVSGHANYAQLGEDIVCAGVSCIMYGTCNALIELCVDGFKYEINEGYFKIDVLSDDKNIQLILKTALIQLETVHTSYAKYIKIKKMEV